MRKMFEQSEETARIVSYLKGLSAQSPISFSDLRKVVGPFKSSSYYSAVRIARKSGVVIGSIRGFGFQRLNAADTVNRQESHFRSIRRKAGVVQSEIATAIHGNLSSKDQMRATQMHAAAGVIRSAAVVPRSNHEKPEVSGFMTPKTMERA